MTAAEWPLELELELVLVLELGPASLLVRVRLLSVWWRAGGRLRWWQRSFGALGYLWIYFSVFRCGWRRELARRLLVLLVLALARRFLVLLVLALARRFLLLRFLARRLVARRLSGGQLLARLLLVRRRVCRRISEGV